MADRSPVAPNSTAARVAHLSPAKRALWEKWRAAQGTLTGKPDRPLAKQAGPTAPLSFAQQRLWFLEQLDPGSPQYHLSATLKFLGPLDPRRLQRAFDLVLQRHDVLRTAFRSDADGRPQQAVLLNAPLQLSTIDLHGEPETRQDELLQRLAREEALRPFDLMRPPLLRASLVQTDDDQYTLILTMHHIVSDGWSMNLLASEIATNYQALGDGVTSSTSTLPCQYTDYAVWQRDRLKGEETAAHLDYWTQQLRDLPEGLSLPTDYARGAASSYRGDVCRAAIGDLTLRRLETLAREENATLYMTLLAALQVLLGRYSRQSDIVVGSPIAARTVPEIEPLIGFFANTLVYRGDLSGNPTFVDLLAQTRKMALEAYAHQETPFDRVVEQLVPDRKLSRQPLFDVMFVQQNMPWRTGMMGDVEISDLRFDDAPVAAFDLTLNATRWPDGLDLSLVYRTDLFQRVTVERMLRSYVTLLDAIAKDPAQRIDDLPLLSQEDQRLVIDIWSGHDRAAAAVGCVHDLVSEQSARTPDAAALRWDGGVVTYRELEARADALAVRLAAHFIGHEDLVAICLPRSPDWVVAMLGVLKAGAAYLLLDIEHPPARLRGMVEDAGAKLALVASRSDAPFEDLPIPCVTLEELARMRSTSSALPAAKAMPDSLAYVVFTSGSTGEPKAIEVAHGGLANHAVALAGRYGFCPGDCILQYLSPVFDAAAEEIFPPLVAGAAIYFHPSPLDLAAADLLDWSRDNAVNTLHIPPPILESLRQAVEEFGGESAGHLKTVLTGGDVIPRSAFGSWKDLTNGQLRLLYAYGVSEATITTTLLDNSTELAPSPTERLPMGRPLPGHSVYVLDARGRPAPPGVPGELYIGGVGVARGYRDRPAMTAQRFLPGARFPDLGITPGRLYRTGDLVRFLPDGNLEFLARLDDQVKLRGVRLEPAEVEAALLRHPSVCEAAVVVADDGASPRLHAYVATQAEDAPTDDELRQFLRQWLIEQMIPATISVLDRLPRTALGKLDVAALPAPDPCSTSSEDYLPPESPEEHILAAIWAEVLGRPEVGAADNFFSLGGDSLQVMQVVARAAARGLRITPKQMLARQTIRELAAVAEEATVSAEQGLVTGDVPLTPIQQEFWSRRFDKPHHFNQALLLEIDGSVSPEKLQTAIDRLGQHHDMLRARFAVDIDKQGFQTIADESRLKLDEVDLRHLSDQDIASATQEHAAAWQASLDLQHGPVARFVYFDLGAGRAARLLIVVHHLVIDAVSWFVLLEDLLQLCTSDSAKIDAALPPKTTSYRAWSQHLTELARSAALHEELAHWTSQSEPRGVPIHSASDDTDNRYRDAATVHVIVNRRVTESLFDQVIDAQHATAMELLLAGLANTYCTQFSSEGLYIDIEQHGRADLFDDVDVSRTIGWFTALFPLTITKPEGDDLANWVLAAKQALRSVQHGGVGFGVLRWLADEATQQKLASLAPRDISFNYLGRLDHELPAEAPLRVVDEVPGPVVAPTATRPHLWEIVVYARRGELHIEWTYNRLIHDSDSMQALAESYATAVETIVDHAGKADSAPITPDDFPLADLDRAALEQVAALLERDGDAA